MAMMVVMVSQDYTYLQTHLIVHGKYAQLFTWQLYLNKIWLFFFKSHTEPGLKKKLQLTDLSIFLRHFHPSSLVTFIKLSNVHVKILVFCITLKK